MILRSIIATSVGGVKNDDEEALPSTVPEEILLFFNGQLYVLTGEQRIGAEREDPLRDP